MRILFLSLAFVAAAACGGADETPLGGPYGGTGNSTNPSSGDNGSTSSGDDAGSTGTGDDSNGNGADSGGGGGGGGGGADSGSGGGGGGGGGGVDAGGGGSGPDASTGNVDSGGGGGGGGSPDASAPAPSAPTWSQLFTNYLASGTEGNCKGCHSQGSSASSLYSWLNGRGYMTPPNPTLLSSARDGLTWYGGGMPQNGAPSNPQAVSDFNAWAAAGAQDN